MIGTIVDSVNTIVDEPRWFRFDAKPATLPGLTIATVLL